MPSARFFLSDKFIDARHGLVTITEPAMISKIRHVLRLTSGSTLTVLDGKGRLYHCLLTKVERALVESKIIDCEAAPGDAAIRVTVALPLLKGERFDWAIQKLTELGVVTVVPIVCARSVVTAKGPNKLLRWQTIARLAAQQCERGTIPQIVSPIAFTSFVARESIDATPGNQLKLLCAERRSAPNLYHLMRDLGASLAKDICLFIGPEGGFTQGEIELATNHSCQLVSLGPRILRAETAAIYALSQVIAFADAELNE